MKFKNLDRMVKELYEKGISNVILYKENTRSYDHINHIINILYDFRKFIRVGILEGKKIKSFKNEFKKRWFYMKIPLIKDYVYGKILHENYVMGEWEYAANHEFGEIAYMLPLIVFENDLQVKNSNSNVIISKISFSDIYGDMFASSLSPLSIDEQLKLIESVRKNKEFKCDDIELRLRDQFFKEGYLRQQRFIYESYLKRADQDDYMYGPELLDTMEEFLNYQRGFDKIKRFNFQLMFFDSAMQAMKSTIIKLGEKKVIEALTHENKDENFNLIVFNHKKIKSNLEKRLEIFNELMKKADKKYNKNSEPYFYLIDWMRVNSS